MTLKPYIKPVLIFLVAGFFASACSHGDGISKRAPINGWHKSASVKRNPAGYHYNKGKQVPF